MKKTLTIILSLLLLFCLAMAISCDKSQDKNPPVSIDYGTLSIQDVKTYTGGYYAEITPIFSNESYTEEINYSYNSSVLKIENGRVYSKEYSGIYTVTATTAHHSTTFNVTVLDNTSYLVTDFQNYLNTLDENLSNFEHDDGKLALYIGDSFFDSRWFFTDFYTRFQGKNAFTWGISSSKAFQWIWYSQKIWKYNPSDIIIHIGTNDVFDSKHSNSIVINDIKTLFSEIHKNLPNTHIYWYSIEPRLGASDVAGNNFCENVNYNIKQYIQTQDYITYLDTNTPFKADTTLYGDTIHPAVPRGYDVMTNVLLASGFEFSANSKFTADVADYSTTLNDTFATSKPMPFASGSFVWKADLTIKSFYNKRSRFL